MLHLRARCFIHQLSDLLPLPPSVFTNGTGGMLRGLFTALFCGLLHYLRRDVDGGCRLRIFDLNVIVHL